MRQLLVQQSLTSCLQCVMLNNMSLPSPNRHIDKNSSNGFYID